MPPLPLACRQALVAALPAVPLLRWPELAPKPAEPLGGLRADGLIPLQQPPELAATGAYALGLFAAAEEARTTSVVLEITFCLLILAAVAFMNLGRPGPGVDYHALTVEAKLRRARNETRQKMMASGSESPSSGAGAQLPAVCPAFLRASAGARISVPVVPQGASTWLADIAVEALAPDQRSDRGTGPTTAMLIAHLRWAPRQDHLAHVVEIEEQCLDGHVLASISSDLEVRLDDGNVFGKLRFMGRRRYVLEAAQDKQALMCFTANREATSLEVGALPQGLLLATAEQNRAGDSMEVLAQPGVDVAFVLACVLAIKHFAPPSVFDPIQKNEW
mmetsp:Transcript_92987/g.240255  ORF Transcript_92987/g.240255 Transcript_92987/m.240255 type:complete len:333 (+) Transcript_92987:88-1086(+)